MGIPHFNYPCDIIVPYVVISFQFSVPESENGTSTINVGTLWDFSEWVVILVGVFTIGAIATLFRSWLFTLAGERFVARLRKIVSL